MPTNRGFTPIYRICLLRPPCPSAKVRSHHSKQTEGGPSHPVQITRLTSVVLTLTENWFIPPFSASTSDFSSGKIWRQTNYLCGGGWLLDSCGWHYMGCFVRFLQPSQYHTLKAIMRSFALLDSVIFQPNPLWNPVLVLYWQRPYSHS